MKHFYRTIIYLFTACLLIHPALPVKAQKGVVNKGAHMDIGQGAYFKVQGSSNADFINLPFDTLEASVDLDGRLMVEGNWHEGNMHSPVFVRRNALGCLILNGSSMQTISGRNLLVFENMELDNPVGLTLQTDINLEHDVILTQGLLHLNGRNLLLGTESGIEGSFSNASMVVANDTGQLRKRLIRNTSFIFPVGDDAGDPQYTPVEFHLTGYSRLSTAWVGVNLKDEQHQQDTSSQDYISRFWQIQARGISDPLYNASFYFTQDDIHGDASNIYNAFINEGITRLFEKADLPNRRIFLNEMEMFGAYTGTMDAKPIVPGASGNWGDQIGVTSPSVNVLIPSGITIELEAPGSIREVNDMTLEPGASLSVEDSLHLTGSLYLESDQNGTASFIQQEGKLQVDGQTYMYGYLPWHPSDNHRNEVASPVNGAVAGVLGPLSGENRLYDWQETTGELKEVRDPGFPLEIPRGYDLKSSHSRVVTFQGELIVGEHSKVLTRSPNSAHPGYHLISNPYAAPVNWDTTLWNNSRLLPTIWYRHQGRFATYNKLAGVGINGGQPYIAPMQAFWVRVKEGYSSGIYRTQNELRTHHRPLSGSRDDLQPGDQLLKLMVESDGYCDELALGFFSGASDSYDEYDSPKRFASNGLPQIYTEAGSHRLGINGMSEWKGPYEIPLCLRFPQQNNYTLRASHTGYLDRSIGVILEDRESGSETDLREQDSYSFQEGEGENCHRFVVHLSEAQTGLKRPESGSLNIYGFENQVCIRVEDQRFTRRKTTLILYNMLGQKMYENPHQLHSGVNRIQTDVPAGYYIIQLQQRDGIRSERIYLGQ